MCNQVNKEPIRIHVNLTGNARNPIGSAFNKQDYISVGFGIAVIEKDGVVVFDGENQENLMTLEQAEKQIQFDINSDYTLVLNAPLWDAKWRRNKDGEWICFESGMGFA